jgi:hypothetical protein
MSATLESTNGAILTQLSALSEVVGIYQGYEVDKVDQGRLKKATGDLQDLQDRYELGSISHISTYEEAKRDRASYVAYMDFVVREGFVNALARVHKTLFHFRKTYEIEEDTLVATNFAEFARAQPSPYHSHGVKQQCECGQDFKIQQDTSEYVCYDCGVTIKLYGMVFEEEHFYYQEGNRSKHGRYDPAKHCQFWMERIMGRESQDIPVAVIEGIRGKIKQGRVRMVNLTCARIRKYLRALKLSKYNDHVVLILKILTGVEPEQLSDKESRLVSSYLAKLIPLYNDLKPKTKTNCPYHPYFLYKTIQQVLTEPSDAERKKKILSRIHLQAPETLRENDKVWQKMCNHIPGFSYLPTRRNEYT